MSWKNLKMFKRRVASVSLAAIVGLALMSTPALADELLDTQAVPDGDDDVSLVQQSDGGESEIVENTDEEDDNAEALTQGGQLTVLPDLYEDGVPSPTVDAVDTPADIDDADVRDVEFESLSVNYETHVQNLGWRPVASDGEVSGTTGKGLRVEGLAINLVNSEGEKVEGVSYQAFVQNIGLQDVVTDGAVAGTSGKSLRIEALRIFLNEELSRYYSIAYRVHIQNKGWLSWAYDGEFAGSTGRALRIEALNIKLIKRDAEQSDAPQGGGAAFIDGARISLDAHVQNVGWLNGAKNNAVAGTTGRGLRVEGVRARLADAAYKGSVVYSAHVQNIGWQNGIANGSLAGTTGKSLRVEALKFDLEGEIADHYDLYYRVHVADYGWLGWASAGEEAGTQGLAKRIEAIQLNLVKKGSGSASSSQSTSFVKPIDLFYSVKVDGEEEWRSEVSNGATAGTVGKGLGLRGLAVSLEDGEGGRHGDVNASVYAGGKWISLAEAEEVSDGEENDADSDEETLGPKLEAMKVSLAGDVSKFFDVYYRVHSASVGWLDWAKNGAAAGTKGFDLDAQAIQIKLVPKGNAAPGSVKAPLYDSNAMGQLSRNASARQMKIVSTCKSTPSPGAGLCAAWVTNVFRNAGVGTWYGDACDQYNWYCKSAKYSNLKVGMIIAVRSHNKTWAGSIWGHVGIYIGDGMIMDNVGHIRTMKVSDWVKYYGEVVTPKWGWFGGKKLS